MHEYSEKTLVIKRKSLHQLTPSPIANVKYLEKTFSLQKTLYTEIANVSFFRMTKCTFHKYGTSGNIENHDVLCILPLNIVNEKIYIFIWFWFLVLGLLSFLVVLYRFIIIFSPYIRAYILRVRFR